MAKKAKKAKNERELRKELNQKRKELQDFKFSIAGSKTRNVREGRNIKKDIARTLTELNSLNKEGK